MSARIILSINKALISSNNPVFIWKKNCSHSCLIKRFKPAPVMARIHKQFWAYLIGNRTVFLNSLMAAQKQTLNFNEWVGVMKVCNNNSLGWTTHMCKWVMRWCTKSHTYCATPTSVQLGLFSGFYFHILDLKSIYRIQFIDREVAFRAYFWLKWWHCWLQLPS